MFSFFVSSIDLSLKDWDVKEQEGLREVEEILDRADEILEVRHTLNMSNIITSYKSPKICFLHEQ